MLFIWKCIFNFIFRLSPRSRLMPPWSPGSLSTRTTASGRRSTPNPWQRSSTPPRPSLGIPRQQSWQPLTGQPTWIPTTTKTKSGFLRKKKLSLQDGPILPPCLSSLLPCSTPRLFPPTAVPVVPACLRYIRTLPIWFRLTRKIWFWPQARWKLTTLSSDRIKFLKRQTLVCRERRTLVCCDWRMLF